MIKSIKQISQDTFYSLIIIYALFVMLIALEFINQYSLQFHILAFIIALLGISIISEKTDDEKPNKKVHYFLFILGILLIIFFRLIPYIHNQIPLGYDAGLYKYAFERGLQNQDKWIISGGMEPGFLYLMTPLSLLFGSQFLLVFGLIFFCVLLGLAVYFVSKEFFGENEAIIALLLYSVSVVQFKVFTYMYYKNIIGLSLMLFSLIFLKKYEKSNRKLHLALFVMLAGLLGSIHRPTFYIFGLSFFVYAFISPIKNKRYGYNRLITNVLSGIVILAIAFSFYIGKFFPAITSVLPGVVSGFISPGESPGTFISFFVYQYSILPYIISSLLGLFYLLKNRKFNILVVWVLINLAIVYFQFFFFNRFIIHLDIVLIILASLGFSILIKTKKRFVFVLLIALLVSSAIITYNASINVKPLISQDSLDAIKSLDSQIPDSAEIMVISKEYSPFALAYASKTIIAPGLFDEDKWDQSQWGIFWTTKSSSETESLMSQYAKKNTEIYLFAGTKRFNNPCFAVFLEQKGNIAYKYICNNGDKRLGQGI